MITEYRNESLVRGTRVRVELSSSFDIVTYDGTICLHADDSDPYLIVDGSIDHGSISYGGKLHSGLLSSWDLPNHYLGRTYSHPDWSKVSGVGNEYIVGIIGYCHVLERYL